MSAQMAVTPLELPAVSPSELQLSRLLCSRHTHYPFTLNDQQCHLVLGSNKHNLEPEYTVSLTINDQSVHWFINHALLDQLLTSPLDHNAIRKLPDDLSQAALQHAFDPILSLASQVTGLTIEFADIEHSPSGSEPKELCLNLNIAGTKHKSLLSATPFVLEILSQLPAHLQEQVPDISIWANLFLGRSILSVQEVNELAMGDVVFLQQHVTGQQLAVRINKHTAFVGEANGTAITLRQRMDLMEEQEELEQQPTEQVTETEKPGISLSELSVELLFEIGNQQFTAREIQEMKPGYVFELDRPVEQPVSVRANGKLIAQCELVQIDNRLGARITKLGD